MKRIPAIAALLNLFPGLGYVYINPKRILGWGVLLGWALYILSTFNNTTASTVYNNSPLTKWDWFSTGSTLILQLVFIIDGYPEAQRTGTERLDVGLNTKTSGSATSAKTRILDGKHRAGIFAASATIPLGIAAWMFLWNYGFIASIVSYGIARGAVTLYTKIAGQKPDDRSGDALLAVIVLGVTLSFLSGIAMDLQQSYAYQHHLNLAQTFSLQDFWFFIANNILYIGNIPYYGFEMLVALVFAIWGCVGIVRVLHRKSKPGAAIVAHDWLI